MVNVNVNIKGLDALERKMQSSVLLDPAIDEALETIGTRLERKGKGKGEQRNAVTRQAQPRMQTLSIEVGNWPRTTGSTKLGKEIAIFKSMSPNVIRSMIRRIEARFAA